MQSHQNHRQEPTSISEQQAVVTLPTETDLENLKLLNSIIEDTKPYFRTNFYISNLTKTKNGTHVLTALDNDDCILAITPLAEMDAHDYQLVQSALSTGSGRKIPESQKNSYCINALIGTTTLCDALTKALNDYHLNAYLVFGPRVILSRNEETNELLKTQHLAIKKRFHEHAKLSLACLRSPGCNPL